MQKFSDLIFCILCVKFSCISSNSASFKLDPGCFLSHAAHGRKTKPSPPHLTVGDLSKSSEFLQDYQTITGGILVPYAGIFVLS